jgi:hypothetical protein
LKKLFTKRADGVAQGVGSEFKPQYQKNPQKKQNQKKLEGSFSVKKRNP